MGLFKALYVVTIGVLVAVFIGFGIETFYSAPKEPVYPTDLNYSKNGNIEEESTEKQKVYDKNYKDFQAKTSDYNQRVAIILIILSVILLAVSIIGLSKIEVIGDGLALGGVFTLFYGIFRAIATQEPTFRFIAIGAALFIILALTYWRFLRGKQASST